jgi:integrase
MVGCLTTGVGIRHRIGDWAGWSSVTHPQRASSLAAVRPGVAKFLVPLLATETQRRDSQALVFPSRRGGHLTPGEVRWTFDPAVEAVRATVKALRQQEIDDNGQAQTPEFPGISPHDLRHSCASLAISAEANVKVLQTLLGHKTATLTLDRYGHLFPDDLDHIADAFDTAAESTADALRTIPALRAVTSD